jgi:hypothetical protein
VTVLLQMGQSGIGDERLSKLDLRSDTEDCVHKLSLRYCVALGHPPDLPFPDSMHRLVTLNRSPRALRGPNEFARQIWPTPDSPEMKPFRNGQEAESGIIRRDPAQSRSRGDD